MVQVNLKTKSFLCTSNKAAKKIIFQSYEIHYFHIVMIKIIHRIFVPWPGESSQRKSAAHLQQYILPLKFFY